MTSPDREGYAEAIRDVVEALKPEAGKVLGFGAAIAFIESRFGSSPETSPERCPTCGRERQRREKLGPKVDAALAAMESGK